MDFGDENRTLHCPLPTLCSVLLLHLRSCLAHVPLKNFTSRIVVKKTIYQFGLQLVHAYYVGYSTRGHSLAKLWPSKLFPWHRPPDQSSVGNSTDQHPCYYFISLYNTSHVLGCDSTCLPGSAKQVESVRAGVCRGFRPILKPLEQGSRLHFAHRSIPAS